MDKQMAEYKNIDVMELHALMGNEKICLVDVRTEAEIAQGWIEGAVKLPLNLLPVRLDELNDGLPTVFYCRIGARSAQAAAFAAANGFSNAYNLQGGVMAWVQAGFPLVV
jgi:rhodanese-related sulfurtransferase